MVRLLLVTMVWGGLALRPATMLAENSAERAESTPNVRAAPGCFAAAAVSDVWVKVVERHCLKCHTAQGEAAESAFLVSDVFRLPAAERAAAIQNNCEVLTRLAGLRESDGRPRLLAKATGDLDHGGGAVVKAGSTELRLLQEFVHAMRQSPTPGDLHTAGDIDNAEQFFDGVQMISDERLLRRVTLSLAARLPTEAERAAVASDGLEAFPQLLDALMREEAFYARLAEGFNDIFLTLGYNGNGDDVLSYNHFQHTRHWYQKHSLDHLPEKDRQKARYKLADDYREALRREPLELLCDIVRNDRPFTEIVTADYTLMSPYTARGYGVYEQLEDRFEDPDDPFEFIRAKLPALKHRDGKVQPTSEGLYPHAGILSMFQYLRRYPTTETNRNRLRARMYYQHFLGVDIMALAPRVGDAAAIDAAYAIPTMQASECVVCHKTIDPVAGLFQDYYNEEGHYGPRKEGWFDDMFVSGFEGTDLTDADRGRELQWLGEHTARDPRFATTMVEHVYFILMGRKVLLPPDDIDDPQFAGKRRAYLAQRACIEQAADRFRQDGFNLKVLFQELIVSDFYRADALATGDLPPERIAELEDVGLVRMLGPEQLERKIAAIFGKRWGRLNDSYAILYGGIDSQEVTERLADPSGAIGSLQRMMANEIACEHVAADFALPADRRRLFPGIEPNVVPNLENVATDLEADPSSAADAQIRAAIVHLHQHVLGREDRPNDPEVDRTYRLFAGVIAAAHEQGRYESTESYFCKSADGEGPRDPDPHYTLRAWRGVVTYLLRQREFLYE